MHILRLPSNIDKHVLEPYGQEASSTALRFGLSPLRSQPKKACQNFCMAVCDQAVTRADGLCLCQGLTHQQDAERHLGFQASMHQHQP